MPNTTGKKITLSFPPDLLKAAKSRAEEDGQTLDDWILDLIRNELVVNKQSVMTALMLGRMDSRIDQQTVRLEQQLESLAHKVDTLLCDRTIDPTPSAPRVDNLSVITRKSQLISE